MSEEAWSQAEWTAYFRMADAFLAQANGMAGGKLPDEIAAAMLYACARFGAFATQIGAGGGAVGGSATDGSVAEHLAGEFDSHLRDHMEERVCLDPGSGEAQDGGPDRVIALLRSLDGRLVAEVSEFVTLADGFLDTANGMIGQGDIGRINAAFMHAAARVNVDVMQLLGHPPEHVDEALVAEFRDVFADLVHYHRQEVLVAEPGQNRDDA